MNKNLWDELWESGTDYQPITEETIKDMNSWKIPPNCIIITKDQLENKIKTIDNKLYSDYYNSDFEDLLEDIKDNPHGEFLLFGFLYNYIVPDVKDNSILKNCKVYEYKNKDIFLIEHNEQIFMFNGYNITIINLYDNKHILFGGEEEITIYNTQIQTLIRLN